MFSYVNDVIDALQDEVEGATMKVITPGGTYVGIALATSENGFDFTSDDELTTFSFSREDEETITYTDIS